MKTRIIKLLIKFLAAQSSPLTEWSQTEAHVRFALAVVTAMPSEADKLLALQTAGLGGNCSQFKQQMAEVNADVNSEFYGKLPLFQSKAAKVSAAMVALSED